MSNNLNANRNEKLYNHMLKVAFEEVVQEEMDSYPSLEELDLLYPRSPKMDKHIKKSMNRHENKAKRQKLFRSFLRCAAAFCIIAFLCAVVVFSVEASRNFIINTIVNIQDDFVALEFGDNAAGEIAGDSILYYVPDGFAHVVSHVLDSQTIIIYENAASERLIFQQEIGISLSVAVDNEQRDFTIIHIDEHELFIFEAIHYGYQNVVIWNYRNYVFSLTSVMHLDSLVEIATDFINKHR